MYYLVGGGIAIILGLLGIGGSTGAIPNILGTPELSRTNQPGLSSKIVPPINIDNAKDVPDDSTEAAIAGSALLLGVGLAGVKTVRSKNKALPNSL